MEAKEHPTEDWMGQSGNKKKKKEFKKYMETTTTKMQAQESNTFGMQQRQA